MKKKEYAKRSSAKTAQSSLKTEYLDSLAYYKKTVWRYVENIPIGGADYDIALLAFDRFCNAQGNWFRSPTVEEGSSARTNEPNRDALRPLRLEHENSVTPELLATLASARLGTPKPKSFHNSVMEAHQMLMAARDYLKQLPRPKEEWESSLEAHVSKVVSFADILSSLGNSNRVPLLPTTQPRRNDGKLSSRALEMALKRYAKGQPNQIQNEIRAALKNKEISCYRLEEIRWHRFRAHFKG